MDGEIKKEGVNDVETVGEGPSNSEHQDSVDEGPSDGVDEGPSDGVDEGPSDGVDEGSSDGVDEGPSDGVDEGPSDGEESLYFQSDYHYLTGSTKILKYISKFNRNLLHTCVCNALSSPSITKAIKLF